MIQVTQKHIQEGTRNDPESCPIALALQEAGYRACVGDTTITTEAGRRKCSGALSCWISDFDDSYEMEPINIDIVDDIWDVV